MKNHANIHKRTKGIPRIGALTEEAHGSAAITPPYGTISPIMNFIIAKPFQ
jgi:hypothetical protein